MNQTIRIVVPIILLSFMICSCESKEEKLRKQIENDKLLIGGLIPKLKDIFEVEKTYSLESIEYVKDSVGCRIYKGIYVGTSLSFEMGGFPNVNIKYSFNGVVCPDGNYSVKPSYMSIDQLNQKIENIVWWDLLSKLSEREGFSPNKISVSDILNLQRDRIDNSKFKGTIGFKEEYINKLSGYKSFNERKIRVTITYDGDKLLYEWEQK